LPFRIQNISTKLRLAAAADTPALWGTGASLARKRPLIRWFWLTIEMKFLAHPRGSWPSTAPRIRFEPSLRGFVTPRDPFGSPLLMEPRHDPKRLACLPGFDAGVHANPMERSLRAVKRTRLRKQAGDRSISLHRSSLLSSLPKLWLLQPLANDAGSGVLLPPKLRDTGFKLQSVLLRVSVRIAVWIRGEFSVGQLSSDDHTDVSAVPGNADLPTTRRVAESAGLRRIGFALNQDPGVFVVIRRNGNRRPLT